MLDLSSIRKRLEDEGMELPLRFAEEDSNRLYEYLSTKNPIFEKREEFWKRVELILYGESEECVEAFLTKGRNEKASSFEDRKRLAKFKSESAPLIDRIVSGVFDSEPSRPKEVEEKYDGLLKNADGAHKSLNEYMEDRATEVLGFGATVIVVDSPSVDENAKDMSLTSKGFKDTPVDRQVPPEEIYLTRYKIFELVDWEFDRVGEANWIRIRQEEKIAGKDVEIFREWDRTSFRVFYCSTEKSSQGEKKEVILHSFGFHNLVLTAH